MKFAIYPTIILLITCSQLSLSFGQTKDLEAIIDLQDKLMGVIQTNPLRGSLKEEEEKELEKFWKYFRVVRAHEIENNKLSGTVKFGLNGNQSNQTGLFDESNASVFNLNGGIGLKRNDFPSQLEINTDFNVSFNNGKLVENISNINISYDRHFTTKNPLLLESYLYLGRRNDQFMGIDQRYEVGGGVIIAHWQKKLNPAAEKEKKEVRDAFKNFKAVDSMLLICLNSCLPIADSISSKEFAHLKKSKKDLIHSIIKNNSPIRIGLLTGLFYELENSSFSDSISVGDTKEFIKRSFAPTNKLRWQLRPTLDFRFLDNSVGFKLRPYFKFPMPWDWTREVNGEDVFDFRMDFPMTMTIQLQESFSIELRHIIYFDNAPSNYLTEFLSPDGLPIYATSNKWNQLTTFQVVFNIN